MSAWLSSCVGSRPPATAGVVALALAVLGGPACASSARSAVMGGEGGTGRWASAQVAQVVQAAQATEAPDASAAIAAAFHPDRLGAMGALTITIGLTGRGQSDQLPPPLRRAVLRLPAGLGVEIPLLRSCAPQRLRLVGARGCPAQSRLGVGRALIRARLGSQLLEEELSLWVFLGPLRNLQPTFEILAQGDTPFDERVVLSGTVSPDNPPYGEDLALSVPPIATLPLEPDASIVWMSLTIGHDSGSRTAREANTTVEPARCPATGFPFAAELTYASGSAQDIFTTTPCPR